MASTWVMKLKEHVWAPEVPFKTGKLIIADTQLPVAA